MIQLRVSRTKRYIFIASALVLLALAAIIPQLYALRTDAAGETFSGSNSINSQVYVGKKLTGLQVNATGNPTLPVNIRVSNGTLYAQPTAGVTITSGSAGKALTLTGPKNDVNTALATVTYTAKSAGSDTVEVSLVEEGIVFYPGNNHLYEFVPDSELDWDGAKIAAAARTKAGLTGYLATITSAEENEFVTARLNGAGWMGGSDAQTEDDWKWVTGPETGTSFWSGGTGGSSVDGEYANWAPGDEPNNAGDEDCTQFLSGGTGLWNDLPCSGTTIDGYVVEYGANGQTSTVATKNIAVTTSLFAYDDGDGSIGDPYQITDCQRFQAMNQDLDAHYVLTGNIDCTETASWDGGRGFTPVGVGDLNDSSNDAPFTGSLDGNGFTIDNVTILRADDDQYTGPYDDNSADEGYVGLFGYTQNATIQDLNVTNSIVKGHTFVGGVIGLMDGGTLSGSTFNIGTADNSCSPGDCVWARYGEVGGGLVGRLVEGTISDSRSAGPVKGSGIVIGGLVGIMEAGLLENSSSSSHVDGGDAIGGAIGMMYGGTAHRVFATGDVDSLSVENYKHGINGGGFVGSLEGGVITESYATGNVHVDVKAGGGFVGTMFSNPNNSITDSYATGDVSSNSDGFSMGGFVGQFYEGVISKAYASGAVGTGDPSSGSFAGKLFNVAEISSSFGVGAVNGGSGFIGELNHTPQLGSNYYDVNTTTKNTCSSSGVTTDAECLAIDRIDYFVNYLNRPFTHSNKTTWNNTDVWYFDGVNLPVLRMGTNSAPSVGPADGDEDGINSVIEDAAPNDGDGNDDGTKDSEQAFVASFVNPVTGKYVVLEVEDSCSITSIAAVTEASTGKADNGFSYPVGLLDFTIDCGTPGFTTTVKQYYYDLSDAGFVVRKLNRTTGVYQTLSNATINNGNPVIVSYEIKDGGPLDDDGVENGIIVDPAGLALAVSVAGAPNTGVQAVKTSSLMMAAIVGLGVIITSAAVATVVTRRR